LRAKLFNFKVDFRRSRIIRTPDLNDVTPLIQANSKQTKREIQKAKSDLQQRWKTAIFECYAKDEFTNMFRKYVQRFVNRFERIRFFWMSYAAKITGIGTKWNNNNINGVEKWGSW